MKCKKAIVLLSGGLDSAVVLYHAIARGYDCDCLVFDYGQKHRREIRAAQALARGANVAAYVVKIALPWKGSALLDNKIKIPANAALHRGNVSGHIPSTYVPARNIIFLSFALSAAEARGARTIFIGAHAQDYSGYPDCRPEFFRAFSRAAARGTKAGSEGRRIVIATPLLYKTKAQIVKLGARLGVPFGLTWSCYRGNAAPCGSCDSCRYRSRGFKEAGLRDPARRHSEAQPKDHVIKILRPSGGRH